MNFPMTGRASRKRESIRIYPFEILYLTGFVTAVLVLQFSGLGLTWYTFQYIVRESIPGFAADFTIGLGLQLLYHLLTRRSLKPYIQNIGTFGWIQLWVRILISTAFLMYAYVWVKLAVPLINWKLYDAELWRIDQWLHFGISPSLFLTELFQSPFLLTAFDYWYSWWLPIQLYSTGFFVASPDNFFRRRFVYSQVLLWTLGLWMYVAWPAVGPVYAFKQDWQHISATMPKNAIAQHALWDTYRNVVRSRQTGRIKSPFNPVYGVAAMPSLHVGIFWLFFLWSRKYGRPLSLFYGFGTFLMLLGSVVTGWHYAIDGYVGMMLAYIAYRASLLVEKGEALADTPSAAREVIQTTPAELGDYLR